MTLTRSSKILFGLVGLTLVLTAVLAVMSLGGRSRGSSVTKKTGSSPESLSDATPLPVLSAATSTASEPAKVLGEEETVQILARVIAERFGTYSTDSGIALFEDLFPLLTLNAKTWMETKYIPSRIPVAFRGQSYGITTRALTAKSSSFGSAKAVILVETQRTEQTNSSVSTFYQNLEIHFVKTSGEWKIDGLYWKEKK